MVRRSGLGRRRSRVAVALAALLLWPASSRAEEAGTVYVYAKADSATRSWTAVSVDGAPAAMLKQGRFFAAEVPAGERIVTVPSGIPLVVEVAAGREVFVRLGWRRTAGAAAIPAFSRVHDDLARKELVHLRIVDAGRILSDSVYDDDRRKRPELRTRPD